MDQSEAAEPGVLRIGVHRWAMGGFSFLLSLGFSIYLVVMLRRNLGLFFGGLVLISILAPLLLAVGRDFRERASILVGIVVAIAVVWLSGVLNDTISFGEWFRATLVLLFYTIATGGIAALMSRIRISPA